MTKVKLSKVIRRCQTRVDRCDTDLLYYVAGEHFESGEIDLAGRGKIAGSTIGPMFYYGFKPGDFLLVSRNPHLRKASRVDFAGICSEKTFVLETADEGVLLSEYLPWVLQNDRFWGYAQENRHGSTNFFINWSTLADYEFELPPIENQKRIAAILWAAQSVRRNYRKLLKTCDDVVKSQFVEMFRCASRLSCTTLSKCCARMASGSTPSMRHPEYYGGDIPFIKSGDVVSNAISSGTLSLSRAALANTSACLVPAGSVLVVTRSALLQKRLATGISANELAVNQDVRAFTPFDNYLAEYLLWAIRSSEDDLLLKVKTVNTSGLDKRYLEELPVAEAPIALQQEFADFAAQVDKSKFAVQKALDELNATTKKILNQELGLGDV